MKIVPAEEFARDISHWLADLEFDGEAILVQDHAGRKMVAIPAGWWCPADQPPPPVPPDAGADPWDDGTGAP